MSKFDENLVIDFWEDCNSYEEVLENIGEENTKKNLQSLKTLAYNLRLNGVPLKRFSKVGGGGGRRKKEVDYSALQQRFAEKRGQSLEEIQEEAEKVIADIKARGQKIQEGIKSKKPKAA